MENTEHNTKLDSLAVITSLDDAYKLVHKAELAGASGAMPIYQKIKRIARYIEAQVAEQMQTYTEVDRG